MGDVWKLKLNSLAQNLVVFVVALRALLRKDAISCLDSQVLLVSAWGWLDSVSMSPFPVSRLVLVGSYEGAG